MRARGRCFQTDMASTPVTRGTLGAALLVAVATIGWLDHAISPDLGFPLFYLLPVVAAGWWLGALPAAGVALASAGSWLLVEVPWDDPSALPLSIWNKSTRLVLFLVVGLLIARVRRDQRRLDALATREAELARTDALTGLPNGRAFIEHLRLEMGRGHRAGVPVAVAYVDLDNFKAVNDRFGHLAGDDVLRRVAAIVRAGIRSGDLAARLGGDELAVVLWDIDADGALRTGGRIVESVNGLRDEFPDTEIGASVGIALFRQMPDRVEDLIGRADDAMYRAKAAGKGCVHLDTDGAPASSPVQITAIGGG
jgi:diguanylate cyclase (GGDEF)-like protein